MTRALVWAEEEGFDQVVGGDSPYTTVTAWRNRHQMEATRALGESLLHALMGRRPGGS